MAGIHVNFVLIFLIAMEAYLKAEATARVKVVVANVNDAVWAFNGDTIVFNCSHPATSGDVWSQRTPDGTESPGPPTVRTPKVGSTFTVTASPSLNGNSYKCILQDFRGIRIFESGWITILLGDKINMTCTSQATVCATVSQSLTKRCTVSGIPMPNITVQKLSGPASSLPSANQFGLTFSAVALEDRGIYTVTAKNVLEEKTSGVSIQLGVDICVAPTLVDAFIPESIICRSAALIRYTVKGMPTPHITWASSFGRRATVHRPIESQDADGVTSVVTSTLEIRTRRTDSNSSICAEAKNGMNPITSTKRCFAINITCTPGAPGVKTTPETNTSVNLIITEPTFGGGSNIILYFIKVSDANGQKRLPDMNASKTGGATEVLLSSLLPGTNYTIAVAAVNSIGQGPSSLVSVSIAGRDLGDTATIGLKPGVIVGISLGSAGSVVAAIIVIIVKKKISSKKKKSRDSADSCANGGQYTGSSGPITYSDVTKTKYHYYETSL